MNGSIPAEAVANASRKELDAMLEALEGDLPRLVRAYPELHDFCSAFIELADAIESRTDPADLAHVRSRIDGMLASHGSHGAKPAAANR